MLDLALDISIVASLKSSMLEQCVERPESVAESGYQAEEDQKHGKSAARSQLPVCSNCGKLLWSMASCCNNPDQEANKSKVHKVELGRG